MGLCSSRRRKDFRFELSWEPLGRLAQPPLLTNGVRFVRNHDTVKNHGFGICWSDDTTKARDILGLAWAFTLSLSGGTCLVWKDDAELVPVHYGVRFRNIMEGTHSAHYILWSHQLGVPPVVAVLRGNAGFALINFSDDWIGKSYVRLQAGDDQPQLEGEYEELQFGFTVRIDASQHVVEWGDSGGTGIDIGKRTVLFFVKKGLHRFERGSSASTVYHAFHEPFATISRHLAELSSAGFDAVQLSPAQASQRGNAWWTRYQPKSYRKIEGLGSIDDLDELCWHARSHGLLVIADVVFNHAQVVGSCAEWREAQHHWGRRERMLQRLDRACENLNRDHYEEWNEMNGPDWDNHNRTRYWGCGEWSTFKPCDDVFREHEFHLNTLLSCGVTGFRFDAVKHMEPHTVQHYMDFLRANADNPFTYMEILASHENIQQEYCHLAPSTDFGYAYFLNGVFADLQRSQAIRLRSGLPGKIILLALACVIYMSINVPKLNDLYDDAKAKLII